MERGGLPSLSATRQRELLARGEISPVELIRACLDRIEEVNPRLNAICTLSERALDDARALERTPAAARGLLWGLPAGIKDVTPVAGMRTTYGSPMYADHVPAEDALIVRRLRAAGAIIMGKTNTPEFAAGGNTFNEVFGRTRNPWDPSLSAGGSTGGGAAALATGMISLAEGTDLGGSLRIPASFCGVFGLRPSPGLVPTYPTDWPWDTLQVSGPMARRAEDVALVLQAVAGPSPLAPLCAPTRGRNFVDSAARGPAEGIRIAYCPDIAGIGVDAAIERVCRDAAFALTDAGAAVEAIELDLSWAFAPFLALRGHWMVNHQFTRLDRTDEFGMNVAANVRAGLEFTTRQLAEAEDARGRLWHVFRNLFGRYDHLLTPCMAVPPFPVEQNYPDAIAGRPMETYIDWIAPTFVLSMTGLPVAAAPCGLDGRGLPVGLQIVGPQMGEESVLAVGAKVQQLRPIGLPDVPGG